MLDPKYIYSIQISILNNFFSCLLKMSLFTLVFKMDDGSILKGMGNENQPRFWKWFFTVLFNIYTYILKVDWGLRHSGLG